MILQIGAALTRVHRHYRVDPIVRFIIPTIWASTIAIPMAASRPRGTMPSASMTIRLSWYPR